MWELFFINQIIICLNAYFATQIPLAFTKSNTISVPTAKGYSDQLRDFLHSRRKKQDMTNTTMTLLMKVIEISFHQ